MLPKISLINGKKDYKRQIDNIKYLKERWDENKYKNVIGNKWWS